MVHLYGVTHGMNKSWGGIIPAGQIIFLPSEKLLNELGKLPKGTRIGIESLPYDTIDVDGKKIKFSPESGGRYWTWAETTCAVKGLDIVHLEDVETWRTYIRKSMEALQIRKRYNSSMKRAENRKRPISAQAKRQLQVLLEEYYRLAVEADYIYAIGRERGIADRIVSSNLHSALVGMAHGDYFFSQREEFEKRGITFESYSKDDSSPDYEPTLLERELVHAHFVKEAQPNAQLLAERESIIRRYNAVTVGRILPDREPHFIGTWNVDLPAYGLFEIYAKDDNGGEIEDTIGSAKFSWRMDGGTTFVKKYDDKAVALGGAPFLVIYKAAFVNGRYEGTFHAGDMQEEIQGKFWMRKYPIQ